MNELEKWCFGIENNKINSDNSENDDQYDALDQKDDRVFRKSDRII